MMRELTAHVRQEPGNLIFAPYTEQANPNRYFLFEVYADDAAFRAHASELTWLRPLPSTPADRGS